MGSQSVLFIHEPKGLVTCPELYYLPGKKTGQLSCPFLVLYRVHFTVFLANVINIS